MLMVLKGEKSGPTRCLMLRKPNMDTAAVALRALRELAITMSLWNLEKGCIEGWTRKCERGFGALGRNDTDGWVK